MQNLTPALLSFFGIALKNQTPANSVAKKQLFISLIGAFFIVLIVSLLLGLSTKAFGPSTAAQVSVDHGEPVAFQPGQYISSLLPRGEDQGYLGQFR
ncbi:MAG: hypothetical protein A3D39_04315 [Candidatus Buchananbacteria bacterium RIFCSPHIGHO2_02_FULL_39_17]|uniref:Uncharacterized protein n=1 Tax=Candidatus Buchananbacteria bacterium RIFCSPLOWO2_01_FULL_40_23b TaxID=1797544 RepID=A0A1G1YQI6_9BACT|nr:MAG: hypothetical protein A3D39_04315 [Candidatus Buchananbacteria bacterium RIFCSPHIGHO2_02_FULL_39_17]OGY54066.1 MAG: hypothetical protein A2912_01700 [Candidatus Buchananbacteria bacterium RIFCSPLOWO2_01_FULL_40_23b]